MILEILTAYFMSNLKLEKGVIIIKITDKIVLTC